VFVVSGRVIDAPVEFVVAAIGRRYPGIADFGGFVK